MSGLLCYFSFDVFIFEKILSISIVSQVVLRPMTATTVLDPVKAPYVRVARLYLILVTDL